MEDPKTNVDDPKKNHRVEDPQTTAQLEKLRLEIADLKWKVKGVYRIAQVISIVSASIAVCAFMVGIFQFNAQQKRGSDAVIWESKKPVREKQLGLVFEVSDVVATIASQQPETEARKTAEARFWKIYYGPIVFAENKDLLQEMVRFGNCLNSGPGCESEAQRSSLLPKLSLILTNKARAALGTTWEINLDDLYKGKFEGNPSPLP